MAREGEKGCRERWRQQGTVRAREMGCIRGEGGVASEHRWEKGGEGELTADACKGKMHKDVWQEYG